VSLNVKNENKLEMSEKEIEELLVGGLKVAYFLVCKTKLWLFSNFIRMEKESELVKIGKFINISFSKRGRTNDIIIDNTLSIDFIIFENSLVVHEIKKSSKFGSIDRIQLLYYLWYLKNIKGIERIKGIIYYPRERNRVEVVLREDEESRIENLLREINILVTKPKPPLPNYKKYCRKCAYFEFCFGDT